jgi:hypothetical protein
MTEDTRLLSFPDRISDDILAAPANAVGSGVSPPETGLATAPLGRIGRRYYSDDPPLIPMPPRR